MGGVQEGGRDMKSGERINVNLRIIPFGHASIEIKGHDESNHLKEKEFPRRT